MLTKLNSEPITKPIIRKFANERECSEYGAFPVCTLLKFSVSLQRKSGIHSICLRIKNDIGDDVDIPFEFVSTALGIDEYSCELDLSSMCDGDGLLYYELLFLRGNETLYTDSINNVDFELSEKSATRFRLLVYKNDFDTPNWFKGKTMYHIFVDRFRRSGRTPFLRDDALLDKDWDNGIPQYSKEIGDDLANNVFFGGDIWGIIEKLDYIKGIGADVIYLSPVFKAYSNHKYDTGDYNSIDETFGGNEAFDELIKEADKKGIRVILDGVFNHSGDDSLYFDKYGKYGSKGAYSDPSSPYRDWYKFKSYPDEYESWWGIKIHPRFNNENEECRNFFVGENGITAKYVKKGIGGWRLDVADELSDDFLDMLRKSVKSVDSEAIIIGEVWENAADKIAYGVRRRYLRGGQLDSVMNYPLRSAIIDYFRYKDSAILADTLVEIYSSYPKCVCDSLMNILGTHDTERILTVLGGICDEGQLSDGLSNDELAHKRLPDNVRENAVALLKIAAVLQYTVYGVPSVFYGDEAGLEGYHDPFCRRPYPWGKEDNDILEFYRALGEIRRKYKVFVDGSFRILCADEGFIAYSRYDSETELIILANSDNGNKIYQVSEKYIDLITETEYNDSVSGNSAMILIKA